MAVSPARLLKRVSLPLAFAAAIVTGFSGPVGADTAQLQHQMQLLQQDLIDLQRHIYQGQELPKRTLQPDASKNTIAQLQVQLQRLSAQMRVLNGKFEESENRIYRLEQRLDKLVTDIDFRLRGIEDALAGRPPAQGGQLGLAPVQQPGIAPATGQGLAVDQNGAVVNTQPGTLGTTIISSQGAQTPAAVAPGGELQPGQQQLATISPQQLQQLQSGELAARAQQNAASIVQPAAVAPAPAPAPLAAPSVGGVSSETTLASASASGNVLQGDTPKQQYRFAMSLLQKRDYEVAEKALREFLDQNREDPLAGNAMYWLGETYYARAQYRDAAATFADSYTNYPKGSKVSDSLLKLARSLEAINEKDAACTSYRTLLEEHQNARRKILSLAEQSINSLNCP